MKRSAREKMRQKFDFYEVPEFEKRLIGYDAKEVDQYLNALVDAYVELHKLYSLLENKEKEMTDGTITA